MHIPLPNDVIEILSSYDFPGNIRELRNIIERAVILAAGDKITEEHLTIDRNPHQVLENELDDMDIDDFPRPHSIPFKSHQTAHHKSHDLGITPQAKHKKKSRKPNLDTIKRTLEFHNGHRLSTAQELGISERTLYRYLKKIEQIENSS